MNLMKKTLNYDDPNKPLMPVIVVKDSGRLSSCLSKAWEIAAKYDGNDWSDEDVKKLNELIANEFDNHRSSVFVGAVEEYTDEERKSVFDFVTKCATDLKMKESVSSTLGLIKGSVNSVFSLLPRM